MLQTVNVAENEMREIIVNAGLGLGEGIVSGVVAADHFVISKQEEYDSARLSYRPVISEKRDQVVFDEKKGVGTIRTDVLYHQRLRPSLEYFELCELAQAACQLEKVYGYPLDMEFCIEGTKMWIVQVRPVPTFESVFRRTVRNYPVLENLCGEV